MSWHFSQALVAACLRRKLSIGEQSAVWSWIGTADLYLLGARTTDCSSLSRFGMTYEHLTANPGLAPLILSLEAFLVSRSARRRGAKIMPSIFGRKCYASSKKRDLNMCSPRTLRPKQSNKQQKTSARWVTKPTCFPLVRRTWMLTTKGQGFGYLHTPTTKANYAARSMQKWKSCRNYVTVFGKPHPAYQEWLMGWPDGWSDLKPLEMVKYQSWQRRLFGHLRMLNVSKEPER